MASFLLFRRKSNQQNAAVKIEASFSAVFRSLFTWITLLVPFSGQTDMDIGDRKRLHILLC